MSNKVDSRAVTLSVRIYERLLTAYPAEFRREFGPAMRQLFRDQCRDAWSAERGRGLAVLWLRVLPDWAKTSLAQHLLNLRKRESVCMKIVRAFRADARLRVAFIRVFAVVFLLCLVTSTLVTIWLPKQYLSVAQIYVEKDQPDEASAEANQQGPSTDPYFLTTQFKIEEAIAEAHRQGLGTDPYFLTTQFKIIESYRILTNVIVNLRLDEKLARQNGSPQRWSIDATYDFLVRQLSVEQTRMTSLIEISVQNQSPELAASIANATADSYRQFRMEQWRDSRLRGIKALEEKQASMTNDLLAVQKNQLARLLIREIAEMGSPSQTVVTVSNRARADLNAVVPTKWRIFLMWSLGGTLLAALTGAGSAWRARHSSAR